MVAVNVIAHDEACLFSAWLLGRWGGRLELAIVRSLSVASALQLYPQMPTFVSELVRSEVGARSTLELRE